MFFSLEIKQQICKSNRQIKEINILVKKFSSNDISSIKLLTVLKSLSAAINNRYIFSK